MTREKKKEAVLNLCRKAQMLLTLMSAVWSGQVLSVDVELRGSVLLDHGIEKFGGRLAGNVMEAESAEDEDGPFAFLVARMGGIEILQIDETYAPEEGE
ncbi:MAG: hypothetical protein IJT94_00995 [Oscillibacter sp.]|nr:hypothetical protein [Oscillibacter sp.]